MMQVIRKNRDRVYCTSNNLIPLSVSLMRVCFCIVVLFIWATTLCFGQTKVFTNDDVLKLVKAGFGEEAIVEAVRTNESNFDTSTDALLALKDAGVSEKIIIEMLTVTRSEKSVSSDIDEDDGLPYEAGIYVLKDGHYVALTPEKTKWHSGFFAPIPVVGVVGGTHSTARINKLESSFRLSGNPEFLIVCPTDALAIEYYLLRAKRNKDKREFEVKFETSADGSILVAGGTNKSAVPFEPVRISHRKFRLRMPPLEKGEYAFLPPIEVAQSNISSNGIMYTFGLY